MTDSSDDKESLLMFFGALGFVFVAYAIFSITGAPEEERAKQLLEQIETSHISIFATLKRQDLIEKSDVSSIENKEKEAQAMRDDAQLMWDAIEVGETIYKRSGGGQWHPVGDNKDVVNLRSEAENIDAAVKLEKIRLAKENGELLLDTSDTSIWETRNERKAMLQSLYERNAWYYEQGVLYFLISGLHILCVIILFVGGPISFLLSFSAAGALFNIIGGEE